MSLVAGFFDSVYSYPGRPALKIGDDVYSYAFLQHRAGQIARILTREAGASILVGILAYRSLTAYAGVLGILVSGRGYVPLHPDYPGKRAAVIIAESGLECLVVGSECLESLSDLLAEVPRALTIVMPDASIPDDLRERWERHLFVGQEDVEAASGGYERPEVGSDQLAYLMFTSGSTGTPKGVPIRHRNVTGYVEHIVDRYDVTPEDRFSQTFDLTFDPSVHDMFACWSGGACLCPLPKSALMAPVWFIQEQALTIWASVPAVAAMALRMRLLRPGALPSLRRSMFCGEPLPVSLAEAWKQAAPNSIVENQYGPTEATVTITGYAWDAERSPQEARDGSVPMGTEFPRQQGCVVDEDLHAVAVGTVGEYCLSGSQVTDGYWQRPELNERYFVRLPGQGDSLWYRTGDLVLRDEKGLLHYRGRMDHQIKIQGRRTELLEIEHVVRSAADTEQVAVLAWPIRNGSAAGVVAFLSGSTRTADEIRAQCRELMPAYMVPRAFHFLDEMPLTLSGKADRGALRDLLQSQSTDD